MSSRHYAHTAIEVKAGIVTRVAFVPWHGHDWVAGYVALRSPGDVVFLVDVCEIAEADVVDGHHASETGHQDLVVVDCLDMRDGLRQLDTVPVVGLLAKITDEKLAGTATAEHDIGIGAMAVDTKHGPKEFRIGVDVCVLFGRRRNQREKACLGEFHQARVRSDQALILSASWGQTYLEYLDISVRIIHHGIRRWRWDCCGICDGHQAKCEQGSRGMPGFEVVKADIRNS